MKEFFSFDPRLLFYGFSVIFFASYGQTFFISIFNTEIRSFYQLSDGQFGLVYALATLSSSLILISFAKLIDYIDLRIYSFIISVGLSLACLGMYTLNNSVIFLFFIIFSLRFFGQGAMSHAGDTTMARYFGKNRGKAISTGTLGGMIGIMILPFIAVYLTKIIGWQHVWLIASLSILIFFLPMLFIALKGQQLRHSNFTESITKNEESKNWKTMELVFDKKFYIFLPISISTSFISTGLTFHQIFIINQKGWTLDMLANGYVFLGIFSIIGLVFGGPIIDKYNTKKTILFSLLPLFIGILTLIFFDSYISLIIYMSFLGINLGITAPFIGSLWAELYGLESIGSVKALVHAGSVFASALSPVIFGYIIDIGLGILSIGLISFIIISISTLLPIFYKHIE